MSQSLNSGEGEFMVGPDGEISTFASAVRRGRSALGTFVLELPARATIECCAQAGLDFAVLDLEHSAFDLQQVSHLTACCRASGIGAIVRAEAVGSDSIARILDMAPDGVMVPAVESAKHAAAIAAACRYRPRGRRGLAPLVRHRYEYAGRHGSAFERLDDQLLVILQIEGREAIAQAGAIAATPGIDAIFIGPYDLSQSLGLPGRIDDDRVLAAGAEIAGAVTPHARLGVFVGDPAAAPRWSALGVTVFAASTDGQTLLAGYEALQRSWPPLPAGSGEC